MSKQPAYWNKAKKYLSSKDRIMRNLIIKYSDDLFFGSDAIIWDRSLNWCLNYDHNDMFYFGKDRIDNADIRSEEISENNDMMKALILKHQKK